MEAFAKSMLKQPAVCGGLQFCFFAHTPEELREASVTEQNGKHKVKRAAQMLRNAQSDPLSKSQVIIHPASAHESRNCCSNFRACLAGCACCVMRLIALAVHWLVS